MTIKELSKLLNTREDTLRDRYHKIFDGANGKGENPLNPMSAKGVTIELDEKQLNTFLLDIITHKHGNMSNEMLSLQVNKEALTRTKPVVIDETVLESLVVLAAEKAITESHAEVSSNRAKIRSLNAEIDTLYLRIDELKRDRDEWIERCKMYFNRYRKAKEYDIHIEQQTILPY